MDSDKQAGIRKIFEAAPHVEDDMAWVRAIVLRLKQHYPNVTPAKLGEYMAALATDQNAEMSETQG